MLILRGQTASKGPFGSLGGIRDVEAGGSNPLTPTSLFGCKCKMLRGLLLRSDLQPLGDQR